MGSQLDLDDVAAQHPLALRELKALRGDLARISYEMGLPTTIGPADGALKRLIAEGKAATEEAVRLRQICTNAHAEIDHLSALVRVFHDEAKDLLAALQELRYACTDKAETMADAAIAKALNMPPNVGA